MPKPNSEQLQRIIKDCFWDYHVTEDAIISMISPEADERKKRFLFEKILLNSTKLFFDLALFDIHELEKMLLSYKTPHFNAEYINRRKNLAEVYFFNMPLTIAELQWKVG